MNFSSYILGKLIFFTTLVGNIIRPLRLPDVRITLDIYPKTNYYYYAYNLYESDGLSYVEMRNIFLYKLKSFVQKSDPKVNSSVLELQIL